MDFKGIRWAGNIYQKFETMCLEVEEVMYEDTVKYVENQVQKVGSSVKKFYSEVMQDLHPPSYVDPVKVAAGELSVSPYAHTDIKVKPKANMFSSYEELKKKETEDNVVSDLTEEKSCLNGLNDVSHLAPVSPRVLVQETRSDSCSRKSKTLGLHKRPIGIKRISQNSHRPKISGPVTPSDEVNVTPSSGFTVTINPGKKVDENRPIFDAQIKSTASEKSLSVESPRQKQDDTECITCCHGLPTEYIGSNGGANACEVDYVSKEFMASNEGGKCIKDDSFPQLTSNIDNNTCDTEYAGVDGIVSFEDYFDMEVVENEEATEPRVQMFGPVEKSKLEETCVLVEGDELHLLAQGTEIQQKSYKKKIREAISSKLRSTRKQDQRVSHCSDFGGTNNAGLASPTHRPGSDEMKLPAHKDSSESDWELL